MTLFNKSPQTEDKISGEAAEPTLRATEPGEVSPVPSGFGRGSSSYLGPGCVLEGNMQGRGSLQCQGSIDGAISLDDEITIGERGTAVAQLEARRIVINGRLQGNALGGEKVEVGASGHVQGDIRAPAVAFSEGAFFEGNLEMGTVSKSGSKTD